MPGAIGIEKIKNPGVHREVIQVGEQAAAGIPPVSAAQVVQVDARCGVDRRQISGSHRDEQITEFD